MGDSKILTREQFVAHCREIQEGFGAVVDHEWELRRLVKELAKRVQSQTQAVAAPGECVNELNGGKCYECDKGRALLARAKAVAGV